MKKVAGTLRLDLAQYRELAAFAQFASDLDAGTRRQLERGQRLMQVIKQGVHAPLDVVKQIVMIYAGTRGFLDDIKVEDVIQFGYDLNDALDSTYADFARQLNEEKALTEEIEEKLKALLEEFKKSRD
jgi:F-type H+-transporting ATPase subunit alpha